MENLREKIESLNNLPTLPHTAQRILKLINDPESRASDIGEEIAMDPALTAKVLRLVNSAFYGLQREVTTVAQAIIYLGFNTIKNLALTSFTFDTLKKGTTNNKRFMELMFHSLNTGFAAQKLSARLGVPEDNEIFTFGLLHDLGKVIQLNMFTNVFIQIEELMQKENIPYINAEKQITDINHTEIADILFAKWTLPVSLRNPIRAHHDIASADIIHKRICAILTAADYIANNSEKKNEIIPLSEQVISTLLLDKADIIAVIEELKNNRDQIKDFLYCLDS